MNNDGNASNLHIDRVLVVVVLEKDQLQEKKPWTLLNKWIKCFFGFLP